jgi:hypothetical protein
MDTRVNICIYYQIPQSKTNVTGTHYATRLDPPCLGQAMSFAGSQESPLLPQKLTLLGITTSFYTRASLTGFVVAPRWPPSSSPKSPFMYEILCDADPDKSVLVLQLNAPGNLRSHYTRKASDRQIRMSMNKLSGRYYPSHRIS